jgi:uncharacterized protein
MSLQAFSAVGLTLCQRFTTLMPMIISSIEALRALYAAPGERALKKQLSALDEHARRFISMSPFLVLSSTDSTGNADASPRGGVPGFVKVLDQHTLLIPDSPGNNRLDSLENLVQTGQAGLLFLIPGVDETLRVNGKVVVSSSPEDFSPFEQLSHRPKVVIRLTVKHAYLHCAKALMRSKLWHQESHIVRSDLPTMGQMLKDQTRSEAPLETQEQMLARYAVDL